jgi:murein tripeptide amidase MpaA
VTSPTARSDQADWFGEYRDYGAISGRLRELAELALDRVTLHALGSSIEGRPLWALRIGGHAPDATPMLINGTQHAREWIAAMVTTCVADRLVRGYDHDPATVAAWRFRIRHSDATGDVSDQRYVVGSRP